MSRIKTLLGGPRGGGLIRSQTRHDAPPGTPGIGYFKGPSPSVPEGLAIPPIMPDPYEPTIQIGKQVWMSKNLKATHYRNGHSIPLTPDPDLWEQKTTGGRCAYDNDESNVDTRDLFSDRIYVFTP